MAAKKALQQQYLRKKCNSSVLVCRALVFITVLLFLFLQGTLISRLFHEENFALHGDPHKNHNPPGNKNNGQSREKQDHNQQSSRSSSRFQRTALQNLTHNNADQRPALIWKTRNRPSSVHCVGENFLSNTWRYTSCHFEHLCYDVTLRDFVVFQPQQSQHTSLGSPFARSSTDFNQTGVSPGPLLRRHYYSTKNHSNSDQPFFPRVLPFKDHVDRPYLELPQHLVWAPFAVNGLSYSTRRNSEMVFDYLFPIYNLLAMFGLQKSELLVSTITMHKEERVEPLQFGDDVDPFLSMMKLMPNHPRLTDTDKLALDWIAQSIVGDNALGKQQPQKPLMLCASHAVIGLGPLTDHGVKRGHGNYITDYQFAQNVGRGPLLNQFSLYCLQNIGLLDPSRTTFLSKQTKDSHLSLLASIAPSSQPGEFGKQLRFLRRHLDADSNTRHSIERIDFKTYTWFEQIKAVQRANIMVSVTGEEAIPAFFLPRGSTLILYYDDVREFVIRGNQQKSSRRPAMVDWDLWNHASHLNVHWLPLSSMESSESMTVLLSIVRNEVESLQRQQDNSTAAVRRQHGIAPPTDAWFGVEQVEYIPQPPVSLVHCLGDNFVSKEAPCYRSCHIRHLCLDTNTSEFVIFSSITQNMLDDLVEQLPDNEFARISTVMRNMSVMEGRNIRFSTNLPWFPKIRQVVDPNNNTEMRGFYLLPKDLMLIPYTMYPSYASNPGHLMWDYFLPFFTLLSMYGNHDGNKNRNENHDAEQLTRFMPISVDNECPSLAHCRKIVSKFLPLVGSSEMWTTSSIKLSAEQGHNLKSSLVCSQHGAVGIGMLTDHGFTRHGQNLDDYQRVHNAGRGATIYNFRSFMLNNLQVPASNTRRKVVFSINSTNNVHRKKDFRHQIAALRSHIQHVTIIAVELSQLSLRDQVELVADAAVFVSIVGGSTSVATLLPRGAAVVLYFCTEDSFVGKTKTKNFPTMMDFDFWNNASYLRLHWLPTGSMDESKDLAFLVQLIRTELDSLQFE